MAGKAIESSLSPTRDYVPAVSGILPPPTKSETTKLNHDA